MTRILRPIYWVIAVLLGGLSIAAAHAQVATWDPEEVARLAEKSARMAEEISRVVELANSIDDLSRTLGRLGSLSNLDLTRFDVVEGMQGAGPEIGGLASNIAGLRNVRISSFNDASAFVRKLTTVPAGVGQVSGGGQLRQALDALHRKATEDGYVLSTHLRESLSVAPQRADLLVAQASAATDLRGDVGANTAAALAVLDQLSGMKIALASILEIQATGRLAESAGGGALK
jgi:hypothetical protein